MKTTAKGNTKKVVNSASLVDRLLGVIKTQAQEVATLVDAIRGDVSKVIHPTKYEVRKSNASEEKPSTKKYKAEPVDKKSNLDYFVEALQLIGRPAMSREIAYKLKNMNRKFKNLSKNKKEFMQVIYTGASTLVKENKINRKAVGGRTFEYSLPSWDK